MTWIRPRYEDEIGGRTHLTDAGMDSADRLEYALLCEVAYGVVIAFWSAGWFKAWVLLPIAAAPLAVRLIARVYTVSAVRPGVDPWLSMVMKEGDSVW